MKSRLRALAAALGGFLLGLVGVELPSREQ